MDQMQRTEISRGHTVRHALLDPVYDLREDRVTKEKRYEIHRMTTNRLQGDDTRSFELLNRSRQGNVELLKNMILDPEYSIYERFAYNGEKNGTNGSLESLHNSYHYLIGGGGHMGRPSIAAFDPAFWIHHA